MHWGIPFTHPPTPTTHTSLAAVICENLGDTPHASRTTSSPVKRAQILSSLRGHVSLSGLQVLHTVVSSYKVWGYNQGGPSGEKLCFQEWSREAQLGKPLTGINHHHGYYCLHQPRCPRTRSISSHSGKRQAHDWPVFQIWEQTLRSVMDNLKVTPPSLILRVNAL